MDSGMISAAEEEKTCRGGEKNVAQQKALLLVVRVCDHNQADSVLTRFPIAFVLTYCTKIVRTSS